MRVSVVDHQTLATLTAPPSEMAAAFDASATPDAAGAAVAAGSAEAPRAPETVQVTALHEAAPEITASVAGADAPISPPGPPLEAQAVIPDPCDDLSLGKRHFREGNFGLAERYFGHAAEKAAR
jgi:hypothetical protein